MRDKRTKSDAPDDHPEARRGLHVRLRLFVPDRKNLGEGIGNPLGNAKQVMVRIGRTLQSFPPSKRSGHLSTHSAFQLGLWTLEGRIRCYRRRGAPAS
jgi:hypothetical protein